MGPGGIESVVRLQFLESVRPALLVEFVEPYRRELAAFGMREDETPGSHPWLMRLFRVLSREDGALPAGLVSGLLTVAALSSEAGYESLLEHARILGVSLSLDDRVLAVPDAALYAYVHYPKLCRLAYRRMRPASVQNLVEFGGKCLPAAGIPTFPAVRELLQRWLEGQPSWRFRAAQVEQHVGQLVFHFTHQRHGGAGQCGLPDLPIPGRGTCDVVAYDVGTDRLSMCVARVEDEDLYRSMAGLVLTGDPEHFGPLPIYSATPFLEQGARALDTRGVEAIDRVSLVRVRVAHCNDFHSWSELSGDAAMAWLDPLNRTGHLSSTRVIDWTFQLFLEGDSSALLAKVVPPNRLWVDLRVPLPQFRKFMVQRGFFRLPRAPST